MEKKATPKKSTSKKTQVKKTTTTKKAAPKKTAQVVKTQTKTQKKVAPKKAKSNLQVNRSSKNANTGYILGLTSLVAWVIPVVGAIVAIPGIYCCYSGMKKRKGIATIGLILNILFLALTIVNIEADFALFN